MSGMALPSPAAAVPPGRVVEETVSVSTAAPVDTCSVAQKWSDWLPSEKDLYDEALGIAGLRGARPRANRYDPEMIVVTKFVGIRSLKEVVNRVRSQNMSYSKNFDRRLPPPVPPGGVAWRKECLKHGEWQIDEIERLNEALRRAHSCNLRVNLKQNAVHDETLCPVLISIAQDVSTRSIFQVGRRLQTMGMGSQNSRHVAKVGTHADRSVSDTESQSERLQPSEQRRRTNFVNITFETLLHVVRVAEKLSSHDEGHKTSCNTTSKLAAGGCHSGHIAGECWEKDDVAADETELVAASLLQFRLDFLSGVKLAATNGGRRPVSVAQAASSAEKNINSSAKKLTTCVATDANDILRNTKPAMPGSCSPTRGPSGSKRARLARDARTICLIPPIVSVFHNHWASFLSGSATAKIRHVAWSEDETARLSTAL
jgi:hypothetical protein